MPRSPLRFKRDLHPMPEFVMNALLTHELLTAFNARPPYQRDDYLGWIGRAKQEVTKQKRLAQMLDELQRGNVFMKLVFRPK